MPDGAPLDYVLGIDLGSNSLGWAMIRLVDGEPAGLIRAGARVFEAGMEGDLESGREESRNKTRRDARTHRRQLWRHKRRLVKVGRMLQRFGLLPTGDLTQPESRQDFNRLDSEILQSPWFAAREKSGLFPEPRHVMPYILRAAALDEKLEPHFLGRALYHLAQRRGFLSNRIRPAKKDDDEGVVKEGINKLQEEMGKASARTLGEYFSRLKPSEERIRARWTSREKMYEPEFEKICEEQAKHHPNLMTPERKKELHRAIFYQRPLWFDPNAVGRCQLEAGQLRAPAYLILSQRFRLLQKVNDLQIELPGELPRYLNGEERHNLSDALELHGDLSFHRGRKADGRAIPSVRDVLGLPKAVSFNLQRGGEDKIPGNRTTSQFHAVFGSRWLEMSAEEHQQAIMDVRGIGRASALKRRGIRQWGLDETEAENLTRISLEPEYANLSRKAIEKLLPLLEQGIPFATARKQAYPESFESHEPLPVLPPIAIVADRDEFRKWLEGKALLPPDGRLPECLPEIRNPAVTRSLTELRKVTNAVIRQYGKPTQIRVELARTLKQPKWLREDITKKNRENEAARKSAAGRVTELTGDQYPSRDDVRRVQLFDECHGHCVYCNNPIPGKNFFGKESQVDVDHIIPFSRSLDDSFMNLVLCHAECNRAKADRTPWEGFAGERHAEIIERVKKFAGDRRTASEKLRRFQMNDEQLEVFLADFRSRQLNDTAYAAKLAKQYLGLLYGGISDEEHQQRVQAASGRATAYLRSLWKLNAILGDGETSKGGQIPKKRTDHRHHAVDAVVIGLTDAGMMKRLSDAAQRAPLEGRRRFASLDAPWPNFVDSVRQQIDRIVVSHRVSKKVSGALHEETIYSRRFSTPMEGEVRVRKLLKNLTKTEVEDIADSRVKQIVLEKLNGGEPKKVFVDDASLPFFQTGNRSIPIRRVRLIKKTPTMTLGKGRSAREVTPGSNHHIEIFAELDEVGQEVEWDAKVVSMYEAYLRQRKQLPVVQKGHGPQRAFKFSLAQGEVLECDAPKGGRRLLVVRSYTQLSAGSIIVGLAPVNDARPKKEMQAHRWVWKGPDTLRRLNPRKVSLSPLGEVSEAHD